MSRKWHAIGLQVALFDPPYPILQPRALLSPARGFIFLQSLSTKNGRNCATLWIQKCGCARARARESSHWVPLHPISHALVLLRPQCSRFPLRMNDPSRRVGPARGLVAGIAGCAMPPFVTRVGPISHLAQITGARSPLSAPFALSAPHCFHSPWASALGRNQCRSPDSLCSRRFALFFESPFRQHKDSAPATAPGSLLHFWVSIPHIVPFVSLGDEQ